MTSNMERLLEELQLIHCSLLPAEIFLFLDHCNSWNDALQSYVSFGYSDSLEKLNLSSPSLHIGLENFNVWFEVTLSLVQQQPLVAVKGEDISRDEQEKWQRIVKEKFNDIGDSEYPIYQLFSLHLLPMLHEEADNIHADRETKLLELISAHEDALSLRSSHSSSSKVIYHALFISHHLISPTKRRNLQQWSMSLSISGFAKVGYPGVIYAEGIRENIEEFVDSVKAMQWLALRLRFMEPAPEGVDGYISASQRRWTEFQKVGDVMEEMRRIGRQKYIVEVGIGSAKASKGSI
ncbi:hypothetical protein C8J55DRAFT_414473 [Lentinula edodes]|uniref:Small nuclear ribonucleoprotein Prp3 C-terminal domain-containing protein n=1 Tax=Lentinula lateritia TaxID=40482 RepID=A0A9W9B3F2_9AGAR|nr:hypothetical protein C8J55DRAFT_414473 [Lentinula edodes]